MSMRNWNTVLYNDTYVWIKWEIRNAWGDRRVDVLAMNKCTSRWTNRSTQCSQFGRRRECQAFASVECGRAETWHERLFSVFNARATRETSGCRGVKAERRSRRWRRRRARLRSGSSRRGWRCRRAGRASRCSGLCSWPARASDPSRAAAPPSTSPSRSPAPCSCVWGKREMYSMEYCMRVVRIEELTMKSLMIMTPEYYMIMNE